MTPPMISWSHRPTPEPAEEGDVPQLLRDADLVFWDFDGVVKDSVSAKSEGFRWIVRSADSPIGDRVQRHHEANGGLTRFEKIPLYLSWADLPSEDAAVRSACTEFSRFVVDAVVDSPWVPGVRDYLLENRNSQIFVLVTATPTDEIEWILDQLDLSSCFTQVFGDPTTKFNAVSETLTRHQIESGRTVFVGDSESDHHAASSNGVPFLLRRHKWNTDLVTTLDVPSFSELFNG